MERHTPGNDDNDHEARALRKSEERFRLVFEHAPIGMLISDLKGRFTRVNTAMADLLGYSVNQLVTMGFAEITHPEDLNKDISLVSELLRGKKPRFAMEKRYVRGDGAILHIMLHGSFVYDGRRPACFIGQIVDITARKQHEQTMLHIAYHDQLTGLPNRMLFRDKLTQVLAEGKDKRQMLAVIFLDLDRFKIINDTLGHMMGDQALVLIADRLAGAVRASDVVARLGGDEFTVMLPNIKQEQDVYRVLPKIIEALEEPLRINGKEFAVSASMGIALYPRDGQDVDTLLQVADQAMYSSKSRKGIND
ncbi:MAG: diguanylate cyclase [Negativicutes bacterium]|nr:diguanylate cyclase [Negativicutes bacterium]